MDDTIKIVIVILVFIPATLLLKKFLDNMDSDTPENKDDKNEQK